MNTALTVQELLDTLEQVEDKSLKVMFGGLDENNRVDYQDVAEGILSQDAPQVVMLLSTPLKRAYQQNGMLDKNRIVERVKG